MNTTTTTTELEPRAWVGCLACYNDGRLSGAWLDAADLNALASDPTTRADIPGLCHNVEHEELWVMDHEHLPITGECSVDEAARITSAVAELIDQADEYGIPAAVALAYVRGSNVTDPDAWPDIAGAFAGSADSDIEYAQNYAEDTGAIDWNAPQAWPFDHIDWPAAARDLLADHSTIVHEGTRYYFRNN